MAEEKEEKQDKGFRVIDRRGVEQPSPAPPSPPPPENSGPSAPGSGAAAKAPGKDAAPETAKAGNLPPGAGVEGEKGRAGGTRTALGAPRFLDLVQSLQVGAMVGLGMVQGPDGKRPPVNLPAAKDAIDLLGVLQEKTKGNLTKEEEDVLREGLYHLRMGYMAMMNAPPAGRDKGGSKQ